MKLSAPWVKLYKEIETLFRHDEDIALSFDENEKVITLRVDNAVKADALEKIMPKEKIFGNVTVKINVVPSNKEETYAELFSRAFEGNSALTGVYCMDTPMGKMGYAVFRREVVQFFDDNISSPYGITSTLYQEIAKDIFEDPGLSFCTDNYEIGKGSNKLSWSE